MQTQQLLSKIQPYASGWKISDPVLVAQTPTSWLFKVKQRKSGAAALKLLRPEAGDDERFGGDILDWYAGSGAAKVFAISHDAVLLEWLDGGPLSALVHEGKDDTATEIICQVVSQLHAPRPFPPARELISLNDRFAELFKVDKARWPFAARDLLIRAQIVAKAMLDSATEEMPLHGDIHHDNILFSKRSWLAIDPKGLIGDPAYEVANCFLNPVGAIELCADTERIARMLDQFTSKLGFDRTRVLGFAVGHAALSACWSLSENQPIKHNLTILPWLISAYEFAAESAR